jgi:hypothetical protein
MTGFYIAELIASGSSLFHASLQQRTTREPHGRQQRPGWTVPRAHRRAIQRMPSLCSSWRVAATWPWASSPCPLHDDMCQSPPGGHRTRCRDVYAFMGSRLFDFSPARASLLSAEGGRGEGGIGFGCCRKKRRKGGGPGGERGRRKPRAWQARSDLTTAHHLPRRKERPRPTCLRRRRRIDTSQTLHHESRP